MVTQNEVDAAKVRALDKVSTLLEALTDVARVGLVELNRSETGADVEALAAELVEDLLSCGGPGPRAIKGDHLRIMLDGRELAGWNEDALGARVRAVIRKATEGGAPRRGRS